MQRLRVSGDELLADTGTVDREAFGRFRLGALLSLLIICLANPAAADDPRPLAAKVLALLGDRVYVAADSGALATGDRLAFADGKHVLAAGRVDGLLDGRVASVALESGTLAGVKKLEKLRVTAEPTDPAHSGLLRVGIPAGARRSRLAACAACTLAALPDWRSERTGAMEWRAIREASAETLLVRLFRDADDESIAWERGDLDVAVFWPDELSAYQLARFRKSDLTVGVRTTDLEVRADPRASGDVSTPVRTDARVPGDAPDLSSVPRRDCPILVRASARTAFDRIGAGVLADLPACIR